MKKKRKSPAHYSLSVEFDGNYFDNRSKIEKVFGEHSHGSGYGFGRGDCAWYGITEAKAKRMEKKIKRLRCVLRTIISDENE